MQNDEGRSPVSIFFHQKWVRWCLVADIVLLLIFIAVVVWHATKVSVISFDITPLDATISVNGDSKYTNGQYSFTPGTYNITISREGLETKTLTIDLAPRHVVTVSTFLSDTDKSYDFYQKTVNLASYRKLAEIASAEHNITTDQDTSAERFIKKFQTNYTAYNTQLPIEYRESEGYGQTLEILKSITIRAKDNCEYTLCVEALIVGTDNQGFIKSLLTDKGFNPEDLEIEYIFY